MTSAATFRIEYLQFLDAHGKVVAPLPAFAADTTALILLYRAMVLMRTYDAKGAVTSAASRAAGRMQTV